MKKKQKYFDIAVKQEELEDMEMLSLVVDAALHDESIAETYPKFYQRMRADKELYQLFADMMAGIRDKSPIPDFGNPNLAFLHRDHSKAVVIKRPESDFWEATWNMVASALDRLFMPATPVYRSAQSMLDATCTPLIQDEFMVDGQTMQATMDALIHPEAPDQIALFLTVTTDLDVSPALQATVQWGEYDQTAVLDNFGRVSFPPFAVGRILNEEKTAVSQNLHLQLHPIV